MTRAQASVTPRSAAAAVIRVGLLVPLAVVVVVAAAACATTNDRGAARSVARVQEGRASYYARLFDGRRTASGERYDPERMTAAHASLPFGTWIRVTRAGGPSVDVRVNDRCGCGGGHIVDLSQVAARRLGMIRAGSVRVRVEVLPPPS